MGLDNGYKKTLLKSRVKTINVFLNFFG